MPQTASIDPVVAGNIKAVMRKKGRTAYSVAQAMGVSPNWLYRIVNMDRGILLPTLREVAGELGVSMGELVDPPGRATWRDAVRDGEQQDGQWRDIPIREVAPAAGVGAEVFGEEVVGYLPFRRDWLDARSIDPGNADIVSVGGESMAPTLPNGCSILVDRKRREPHEGRIYVMRTDEGLVVKRLGKDEKGRWLVVNDNPDWPPAPLLYGTDIIGEVRWLGRTF